MASHLKNRNVYSEIQYIGDNSGSGKTGESANTVPQSSLGAKLPVIISDRHTKQEGASRNFLVTYNSEALPYRGNEK